LTSSCRYDGVPHEFVLPGIELRTGFMATPDGATVAGQPEVAAGWFPVNDHPLDKARYSFDVTVPRRCEVVANGFLTGRETKRGWTTYEWDAREPMASYLATIDIGHWDVHKWRTDTGLPVYDAVDSAITGGLRAEVAWLSWNGQLAKCCD
jgi:aminopeptidase N